MEASGADYRRSLSKCLRRESVAPSRLRLDNSVRCSLLRLQGLAVVSSLRLSSNQHRLVGYLVAANHQRAALPGSSVRQHLVQAHCSEVEILVSKHQQDSLEHKPRHQTSNYSKHRRNSSSLSKIRIGMPLSLMDFSAHDLNKKRS